RLWQKTFRDKDDVITDSLRKQAEWICPRERVKGTSISRKNIEELARKLQDWAEKVAKPPQPKTAELCKRLVDAAQRLTVDLSPLAFEKLLDSVLGDGENSVEHRQPMPWKQINDPGQLWTELNEEDIVIWWDFTNDGSALRDSYVWSDKEKEWLGKDAFFDVKLERLARTCAMTAPFRFARRIITVMPRFHGSEEAQSHPLRDFLPKGGTVRLAASSVLTQQTCEQDFFHIAEKDSLTPPPAPAQWNENKGEAIPLPEKITPSGLETVLDCPAAWYFKDVLGLDYERTTLSNESIVCGNLAHEVMEVLLKEWRDAPVRYEKGELLKRISDQLDTLAQDKAARLALPEFDALRKGMASRLARSFIAFCDHLEKEDLVFLDSEQTYKGLVGAVECTGRYDILLGRKDDPSPCAVADMKWSRRKIYEVQTEKGRVVQLAAYHHLLKKGRKVTGFEGGEAQLAAPAPADLEKAWFFLLPDAKILGCTVPLAEQWQGIEEEWEAMCAALRSGRLLLAEDPAQDEPAEGKPARKKKDEGPCKWCAYKKLCGRTMSITDDDDEGTEDQE
ncbi:MAG: PD-(D/E)XK nuclease family protein, partial [Mailhella sp.]|nr:PD-(D/E)XK nuclease family protein [Mailhella sp.]